MNLPTSTILALVLAVSIGCPTDDPPETSEASGATDGTQAGEEGSDTQAGTTAGEDSSTGGASGSDGSEGGSDGSGDALPEDGTEEGIAAFLAAKTYQAWMSETAMPRPASDSVSPHGTVRVYFNDVLIASQKAGKGTVDVPHDPLSMTVKELYDDGGTMVGQAAMLNANEKAPMPGWIYHCWGPANRCSTGEPDTMPDTPIHGQGFDVGCGACHGGMVFTQFP